MTRSSVLVFSFLLVAPCASMKMKAAAGPDDLKMPNCMRLAYNQLSTNYGSSCYIYHSFLGYHPETGEQNNGPEMYGFGEETFILDGVSDELLWKSAHEKSSWPSGFMIETADGSDVSDHGIDCNKRSSTGNVIPGFLDTCPHGPIWKAESNYNKTLESLKEMKHQIKNDKKVLKIVAKEEYKHAKEIKKDVKDNMDEGKRLKKFAKDAKDSKKKK